MVRQRMKGTEVDLGSFGKGLVFSHSDRKKTQVSQVTACTEPKERATAAGMLNLTTRVTEGLRRSTIIQPINHTVVGTCWEQEFRENAHMSVIASLLLSCVLSFVLPFKWIKRSLIIYLNT